MLHRALPILVVIVCSLFGFAQAQHPKPPQEFTFEKVTPLGLDGIEIDPIHKPVTFLASVTTDSLDGMRRIDLTSNDDEAGGVRSVVYDKMGAHVKSYPAQLRFRVTANAHDVISDDQFLAYKSNEDINTLLLDLHFLLKAFDGLTEQEFSPSLVRHIGVPEDVPSDERIYDVHFDIGKLPCERRLVLELADGKGVRLAKFHLELM